MDSNEIVIENNQDKYKKKVVKNIFKLLQPIDNIIQRCRYISYITVEILKQASLIINQEDKIRLLYCYFNLLIGYKDVLYYPEMHDFVVAIYHKFNELIIEHKLYQFISIYNRLFNDHKYDDLQIESNTSELTPEECNKFLAEYNLELQKNQYKMQIEKMRRYEDNELVGAKDKSGNWWAARILKVFEYNNQYIYYVEFMGWGPEFNEFIANPYRLARYNPYKHPYYKNTIKLNKKQESIDAIEELVLQKTYFDIK